jgi:lysozyme
MNNISIVGYNLIKREEGFRAKEYKDLNGFGTIGYGHKILPGEVFGIISPVDGTSILVRDVQKTVDCINSHVTKQLAQYEMDALCSLVFNIGCSGFASSQVLHFINIGKMDEAAEAFKNWHRPNLMGRREREICVFKGDQACLLALK